MLLSFVPVSWGSGLQNSWVEGTLLGRNSSDPLLFHPSRQAQIDPKTADIASMKTQTRAMEDELNDYKRFLLDRC